MLLFVTASTAGWIRCLLINVLRSVSSAYMLCYAVCSTSLFESMTAPIAQALAPCWLKIGRFAASVLVVETLGKQERPRASMSRLRPVHRAGCNLCESSSSSAMCRERAVAR